MTNKYTHGQPESYYCLMFPWNQGAGFDFVRPYPAPVASMIYKFPLTPTGLAEAREVCKLFPSLKLRVAKIEIVVEFEEVSDSQSC